MIRALAGLALLAAAGPAASDPARALAGRYDAQFPDALVSGEHYTGQDIVKIVPVAPRAAYIRFHLDFYNGHSCSLAKVARAEGGELVYREPASASAPSPACHLHIRRAGAKLAWSDEGGSCKSYCGARGSFLHGDVPWRSKRPITYMAALKASRQYRDALVEWRTGKPAP